MLICGLVVKWQKWFYNGNKEIKNIKHKEHEEFTSPLSGEKELKHVSVGDAATGRRHRRTLIDSSCIRNRLNIIRLLYSSLISGRRILDSFLCDTIIP